MPGSFFTYEGKMKTIWVCDWSYPVERRRALASGNEIVQAPSRRFFTTEALALKFKARLQQATKLVGCDVWVGVQQCEVDIEDEA